MATCRATVERGPGRRRTGAADGLSAGAGFRRESEVMMAARSARAAPAGAGVPAARGGRARRSARRRPSRGGGAKRRLARGPRRPRALSESPPRSQGFGAQRHGAAARCAPVPGRPAAQNPATLRRASPARDDRLRAPSQRDSRASLRRGRLAQLREEESGARRPERNPGHAARPDPRTGGTAARPFAPALPVADPGASGLERCLSPQLDDPALSPKLTARTHPRLLISASALTSRPPDASQSRAATTVSAPR